MTRYKAPWSKSLVVVSVLATVLCLGVSLCLVPIQGIPRFPVWLPAALVPVCALFVVCGYSITPDAILVHRPFWDTRLPRAGLESATFVPHAMRGSIRTCGNGGFFSFTGIHWSKKLRSYRAFVTDPARTVVLRYDRRTVVVSPDAPEEFAKELTG